MVPCDLWKMFWYTSKEYWYKKHHSSVKFVESEIKKLTWAQLLLMAHWVIQDKTANLYKSLYLPINGDNYHRPHNLIGPHRARKEECMSKYCVNCEVPYKCGLLLSGAQGHPLLLTIVRNWSWWTWSLDYKLLPPITGFLIHFEKWLILGPYCVFLTQTWLVLLPIESSLG